MNPQNQKPENTNPDLDFIRNTTDPLEAPVKKGLDKKIIVIIVLVVITLGVLVFGMVTGANNNVKKEVKISSSRAVADKFVKNIIKDENIPEAIKLLGGKIVLGYKENYAAIQRLKIAADMSSCTYKNELKFSDFETDFVYSCDNDVRTKKLTLAITTSEKDPENIKITAHRILDEENN